MALLNEKREERTLEAPEPQGGQTKIFNCRDDIHFAFRPHTLLHFGESV